MLAIKSVRQKYTPSEQTASLLETFRLMVNECIRVGLVNGAPSLKKLSLLSYRELGRYDCLSYYKLCAISRAAGILASRKKSIRRGIPTRSPYSVKPQLISCYGFKIENGTLKIPIEKGKYFEVRLNPHMLEALSDPALRVRSFTLTADTVSLCVSKEVPEIECTKMAGVDRNLRNLTYGNEERVIQFDLSRAVKIGETTKEIVSSFKRTDARIRQKIASKYGMRRRNRVNHLLHCATKQIAEEAAGNREAIVLEDIKGIRKLYERGNGQGRSFRGKMNGWSFGEAQRQIEYKAAWKGVPIIHLSKGETRGTTMNCPRCGERLRSGMSRQTWCPQCEKWMDRDVVAVINQSRKGWVRFARSKGGADEAVKGNAVDEPLILRVDASKLAYPPIS